MSITSDIPAVALASPFSGVRLWRAELGERAARQAAAWLSPSENERAARFAFARDAQRYRAAHVVLRQLLGQHSSLAPRAELDVGRHGKPGLRPPLTGGFSLSHSGAHALIAIAECDDIGVDLELLRPLDDAWELARQTFSPAEVEALRQRSSSERARAFLTAWTRKEACLKAAGTGLTQAPASIEVGLDERARTLVLEIGGNAAWVQVQTVQVGGDMLAAIARVAGGSGNAAGFT